MRNASIRIEKLGAFPCPVSVKIVGPRRSGDAGWVLCIVISHNILLLLILLSPASVDMAESETLSFRCAFILSGHCYSHITMLNSTLFWWPPPPACHPANLCVRSNNYHGTNTVGIRFHSCTYQSAYCGFIFYFDALSSSNAKQKLSMGEILKRKTALKLQSPSQ